MCHLVLVLLGLNLSFCLFQNHPITRDNHHCCRGHPHRSLFEIVLNVSHRFLHAFYVLLLRLRGFLVLFVLVLSRLPLRILDQDISNKEYVIEVVDVCK